MAASASNVKRLLSSHAEPPSVRPFSAPPRRRGRATCQPKRHSTKGVILLVNTQGKGAILLLNTQGEGVILLVNTQGEG